MLEVEVSRLTTDGGLPDAKCLEDPRDGGGGGSNVADGEVSGGLLGLWDEARIDPSRRDGGGGGALVLSERGLPLDSDPSMFEVSSSAFGESLPESLRLNFESWTSWLCRRDSGGAGGVFFLMDDDGDGGSGVLPAASLSNTDSLSDSWLARFGAGGRGLLRSVWERELELK